MVLDNGEAMVDNGYSDTIVCLLAMVNDYYMALMNVP